MSESFSCNACFVSSVPSMRGSRKKSMHFAFSLISKQRTVFILCNLVCSHVVYSQTWDVVCILKKVNFFGLHLTLGKNWTPAEFADLFLDLHLILGKKLDIFGCDDPQTTCLPFA